MALDWRHAGFLVMLRLLLLGSRSSLLEASQISGIERRGISKQRKPKGMGITYRFGGPLFLGWYS